MFRFHSFRLANWFEMVNALIFNPASADEFFRRGADSGFVIGEKIQFARLVFGFESVDRFKDFNSLPGEFNVDINFSSVKDQ
jgi:hypothetical protein